MRSEHISIRSERDRLLAENLALRRFNTKLSDENRLLRYEADCHLNLQGLKLNEQTGSSAMKPDIFSSWLYRNPIKPIPEPVQPVPEAGEANDAADEALMRELDEYLKKDEMRSSKSNNTTE